MAEKISKVFRYVHEWSNASMCLVFHTIPMIHIAEKEYYSRINALVENFNHVLIEGVPIKLAKEIGTYKEAAESAGLSTQLESLIIPNDVKITNIDMDAVEFNDLFRGLSMKTRTWIFIVDRLIKSQRLLKKVDIREMLRKSFQYPDWAELKLMDPKNHMEFRHRQKPDWELLIENDRDVRIKENIKEYIEANMKREYRLDTGILFGDAHMPSVYETLQVNGFRWRVEEKLTVI